MFLKSVSEEPVIVSLTTGHAICISAEGREVPPAFVADALKTGQVVTVERTQPAAVVLASAVSDADDIAKLEAIKTAIKAALEADDKSLFTAAGLPDARKLDKMVGAPVSAAERDAAWSALQAEAGE